MLPEYITQLNWIDIFVLILLFRVCYIAVQTGIPVEFFKLLGIVVSLFFSLHYYTGLADFMRKSFHLESFHLEFLDFLSFVFIAVAIYLIVVAMRMSLLEMFKVQAPVIIDKWGGLALGICRSFFLVGFFMYMLAISSIPYVKTSVGSSYLGRKFFNVAPAMYSAIWNGLGSKFMTGDKFNKIVEETKNGLKGKSK